MAVFALFGASASRAAIHTEYVDYKQGATDLRGYLAYDGQQRDRQPGVLIVHEWTGEGPYVEMRARRLAALGYVAFACDIYGKGVRPTALADAGATSAIYKKDRALTRLRVESGLDVLRADKHVDPKRIACIGYCFGGMVALELARSGADIAGVVVFHGALDTPTPQDAKNIKCKILVQQGGDDKTVPQPAVEAFEQEMRDARVDWALTQYGGAVHGYTNPANGNDPSKPVAYNAEADRRSWRAMIDFFNEIFE
jgi:dienelactone hydrolase